MLPVEVAYEPTAQAAQPVEPVVAPVKLNMPEAHCIHADCPTALVYAPAGHGRYPVEPPAPPEIEYEPAGTFEQAVAPANEYCPTTHAE